MVYIDPSSRLVIAAVAEDIKKKTEPIFRRHILMGALKSKGRITFNHHSDTMEWFPRIYRQPLVVGTGEVGLTSFPRINNKIKCSLPYRWYEMGGSWTKFEELASKNSKTARFDIVEELVSALSEDFLENFNDELFADGNAGAGNRIHGLESIYEVAGLVGGGGGGGVVGDPSDTYAGQSTKLGELGGDWLPDDGKQWPTGKGKTEYHGFSPMVIDYNNTAFGGTTASWKGQWRQVLNYATSYGETLQRQNFDLCLLNTELMREAKDSLITSERFVPTAKSALVDLGYQTMSYEGLELDKSYGVPDGVGYLLRMDRMELRSMQSQLIMPASDFDIATSESLRKIDSYCQLRLETPAFFAKLQGISAAGT